MDTLFDVAGKRLAELTSLIPLQSRGTIRIICSDAGHEKPEKVSKKTLVGKEGLIYGTQLVDSELGIRDAPAPISLSLFRPGK